MATANNLIRFAAFPVYNAVTKQYRYRRGVEFGDNSTFITPTFNFALPSFMIKIPATAKVLDGFTVHYLDGSVYLNLETDNIKRVTYLDNGTLYDVIAYYGSVLLDNSKDIVELACGDYYASVSLEDEVYYTETFKVFADYSVSEDNIVTNGGFEYNLNGWQYNGADVSFSPGEAIIEGSANTAVLRQTLTPEVAPFQYELTLDITLDPTIELRVRITDGTNITRTFVYVATGVYTEIIDNPVQIRFETSVFSGGDFAYINNVSIKKITTVGCFNRLVWGHDCQLNGLPYYIHVTGVEVLRFSQTAMFTALVSSPKFVHVIDESTNEAGLTTKNFESVERRITVAASPVPQFLVDSLQVLPLHDTVTFIDINNVESTPDFTEANEPEAVLENIYFTQNIELVDATISDANCCTVFSVACPDAIFSIDVAAALDDGDEFWNATINPTAPVSGFEDAVLQLFYTDVNILASCPASPPSGYTAGGTYTQDQLNNGEITMSIRPDARKWCFRIRVSMPQCPDINTDFTNADSFNANIPA
jgi:hypothetical protein